MYPLNRNHLNTFKFLQPSQPHRNQHFHPKGPLLASCTEPTRTRSSTSWYRSPRKSWTCPRPNPSFEFFDQWSSMVNLLWIIQMENSPAFLGKGNKHLQIGPFSSAILVFWGCMWVDDFIRNEGCLMLWHFMGKWWGQNGGTKAKYIKTLREDTVCDI